MSTVRVRASVDRFEEDQAVLLLGEHGSESGAWPRSLLPDDAVEGTVLEVTLETDAEESADAAGEIRRLLSDLADSE